MEVIKHGKMEVTCENCGCVFRYEAKDTWDRPFPKDARPAILVNCPECNKPHVLVHKIEWVITIRKATEQEKEEVKEDEREN